MIVDLLRKSQAKQKAYNNKSITVLPSKRDPDPNKEPPIITNIQKTLKSAHAHYKSKFRYANDSKLLSVDRVCIDYGIPATSTKLHHLKQQKSKVEHSFWLNGLNKILEGYTEAQFDECFLKFILSLDFANISESERHIITANILKYNTLSARAQKFLE